MVTKRIKSITSSRIGFAILINITALFVSLFLFHPYWEEIDDIWIANFIEGAFGDNEPHVLFSNIIYARILCMFQKIIPYIRWHAIFEILFIFFICVVFAYVLAKDKRGRLISVLFISGCFYEIYVALQFSKIPTFIAAAAYMILFELLSDRDLPEKNARILYISAYLSLLYAMLLRPESFLLATMVAGNYGIVRVVFEILNRSFVRKLKGYCRSFIPVAVMFVLCFTVDRLNYTGPEWDKFKETWDLTESMIDYHNGALLYDDHAAELREIGVSENDAFMFITWQYGDDDHLNADLLTKIISIDKKGIGSINTKLVKAWVDNIYDTVFVVNPLILAYIPVLGIYIGKTVSSKYRSHNIAVIITQTVLMFGVLFYYQYSGRWSHRIVYALLLAEFILLIYLLNDEPETEKTPTSVYIVAAVLAFAIIASRITNEFEYQKYLRKAFVQEDIVTYMMENKDKLFVADTFTIQDYDRYNVLRAAKKGQFDNMTMVGGSYTNSPMDKKIVDRYGYENPFKALEGRDENVILIDNLCPDRKLQYCNDHGDGGKYNLIKIGSVGGLDLYNIR